MSDATVEEFRARLRAARARLLRAVIRTDDELATLEAHPAGALSEDAPSTQVAAVLSRLEGRDRRELDEIQAAQARLESGTYGVCTSCHQPVPLARLRAMPATRYCAACQRQAEA